MPEGERRGISGAGGWSDGGGGAESRALVAAFTKVRFVGRLGE
jgi:hypothetical protein